jgi:hypothetical protein
MLGLDLYYGSQRIQQDKTLGKQLIQQAEARGVEEALSD